MSDQNIRLLKEIFFADDNTFEELFFELLDRELTGSELVDYFTKAFNQISDEVLGETRAAGRMFKQTVFQITRHERGHEIPEEWWLFILALPNQRASSRQELLSAAHPNLYEMLQSLIVMNMLE